MSEIAEQARRQTLEAAREAVKEAAEEILRVSDANLPKGDPTVDPDPSFALVEHGTITYSHGGLVATIRYEGPYAAMQHENMRLQHPRGGKAKFLADALKAEIPKVEGIAAGKVRARVKARR